MSFRTRIAVTTALAVAGAVLLVAIGVFASTQRALLTGVDRGLQEAAAELARGGPGPLRPGDVDRAFRGRGRLGPGGGRVGDALVQVVTADGSTATLDDRVDIPVDEVALSVASGDTTTSLSTVEADGQRLRVIAVPAGPGRAIQVARPIDDIEASMAALATRMLLAGIVASLGAALVGTFVARRAVRPVQELTSTAREVASTGDLSHRITVETDDELGQLATTFNDMLAALEAARRAQHQLVADASHELRTPLTSLRTNIEVLDSGGRLTEEDRRALTRDVVAQLDEFGRLVTALVELARGDEPLQRSGPVRLDELVEEAVGRARTNHREVVFELDLEPTTVDGDAARIERAVTNLLDNAAKYAGAHGPIEVGLTGGRLTVRDHGPGVPEPERERIFDRFYRSAETRSHPGSGLGLAIVRQAARAHGGEVEVTDAPGGGARFALTLPETAGS